MAPVSFKPKDILEGSSNFNYSKARILATLEENDLDDLVINVVNEPITNAGSTTFKRNQSKERRIIYDSIKDNLMPVITPLKIAKECFDTLTNLYEKKTPSQKRFLKNKLRTLKLENDGVASFFRKIS